MAGYAACLAHLLLHAPGLVIDQAKWPRSLPRAGRQRAGFGWVERHRHSKYYAVIRRENAATREGDVNHAHVGDASTGATEDCRSERVACAFGGQRQWRRACGRPGMSRCEQYHYLRRSIRRICEHHQWRWIQTSGQCPDRSEGSAPIIQVSGIGSIFDGTVLNENITDATFIHFNQPDPNTGTTDFVLGDVHFINDPTGLALIGTSVVDDPSQNNQVIAGRLFVDTVNRKIFLPAAGAVPYFTQKSIARNVNYHLAFLTRVGALSFFKDGGSVDELAKIDAEFDLTTKQFKGTLPINLKLSESAENPQLQITLRASFNEAGIFSGAIDGFKFRLAGLLMDVAGVTVKKAEGANSAEFTAATVKVLKTDNPDVPSLDPTDASLIFKFTNLKYKDSKWEIAGVEVPVKDFEFGAAFKMVNQTLGLISEQGIQSLQIKSTMRFGDANDATNVPVIMKIGRTLVNSQFKPTFSAGLQNVSPKLGTLTFNLQGAVIVGDAAQDFYGIKATTAALQWPPQLGGKTAAAISNFKLGVDKQKKLIFALGSGTVQLPEFESNVLKGTLAGTVGTVGETVQFTVTGNLNLKLPGNSGVGTTANMILRYGKDVSSTPPPPPSSGPTCRNTLQIALKCPGRLAGAEANAVTVVKTYELNLTGFSFKVAGFEVTANAPRGTDDGGFAADTLSLKVPIGLNIQNNNGTGIALQGLLVTGVGAISIQGGSFEIAPVSVGGVQFVGLKGSFVKKSDNTYEFQAGGKMPLPGIEPGTNSGGISVAVVVRATTGGSFTGMGVQVDFASPPLPAIPIGSTGMNLTGIGGSFDINNNTVQIGVNMTAASKFQIPLGSLVPCPSPS